MDHHICEELTHGYLGECSVLTPYGAVQDLLARGDGHDISCNLLIGNRIACGKAFLPIAPVFQPHVSLVLHDANHSAGEAVERAEVIGDHERAQRCNAPSAGVLGRDELLFREVGERLVAVGRYGQPERAVVTGIIEESEQFLLA